MHIFSYPFFYGKRTSGDFIKQRILLDFVKKLNSIFNSDFNLDKLKFALSIPLSTGSKNDIIVFYCIYDRRNDNLLKLSFHINPDKSLWLSQLLNKLKNNNRRKIGNSISQEKIQFLGFDFLADGRYNLKIYQRFNCLPRNIPFIGKREKKLVKEIDSIRPQKDILLMNRFNSAGILLSLPQIYLYHSNNPNCQSFLSLETLKPYRNFIREINPYINIFNINWTAFKDNRLEFYFR